MYQVGLSDKVFMHFVLFSRMPLKSILRKVKCDRFKERKFSSSITAMELD
jgi:hypothetical protein